MKRENVWKEAIFKVFGRRNVCLQLQTDFQVKENILIVRLAGELAHYEASILRDEWQAKIEKENIQHVILNLNELTFMDSSGIGVILGRYKEIVQRGGELIICSLHPQVERILQMAGLFKLIRKAENEQYALLALGVAS